MTWDRPAVFARLVAAALIALLGGCHATRVVAPLPPLRAASANDFAVDIEFAESLDRTSAEDVTRYTVRAVGGAGSQSIFSATVIDTFYGRVVQLLIADGPLADTAQYSVEAREVRNLSGRSTGVRSVTFRSGLSYRAPLRELFDSRCSPCHGASQAGGNYRTDSYGALLGTGVDATPNTIASDPNSLLVRRCRPGRSMWTAGGISYLDFEMILNWVVSYGARL